MEVQLGNLFVRYTEPKKVKHSACLLFVHGAWASSEVWMAPMEHFSGLGYRCAALDLRGHGRSGLNGALGSTSIMEYVTDVMAVANALENVVLIGHSMGGLICQRVAHERELAGAVLIQPAPPKGIPFIGGMEITMQIVGYLPQILGSQAFTPAQEMMNKFVFHQISPSEQAAAFSIMGPESGTAMREILLGTITVDPTRIHCPLFLIAGHNDRMVSKGVVNRIANRYSADYTCYRGHSHWIMGEEGWQRVADDIDRWIGQKILPALGKSKPGALPLLEHSGEAAPA